MSESTPTSSVYDRLAERGITLPPLSTPAAAYVPFVRSGSLVFLSGHTWIGTLRQDARGHGECAFKRPFSTAVILKPQRGTVHNDGTIGYPAVIGPLKASGEEIAKLQRLRLKDFDTARRAVIEDGYEFILVISMERVVGEWLDRNESNGNEEQT